MLFILYPIVTVIITKPIQASSFHRIVDGFDCFPKSYPHLVAIKTINSGIFCGGSLVSKYWVLTAGHCCTPLRVEQFIVFTGLSRRSYIRRSTVRRRIIHPGFTIMPLSSDICLLQLTRPIHENAFIKYMKIADTSTFNHLVNSTACNKSLTLGFGSQGKIYLNYTEEEVENNNKLQCVYQRLMPSKFCIWNALVDETMICTLSPFHTSADVCKGDSGGPLICQGVQIGLVSAGKGCGVGTPSYFTRVDLFYDFIWLHANANVSYPDILICMLNLMFIFNLYKF